MKTADADNVKTKLHGTLVASPRALSFRERLARLMRPPRRLIVTPAGKVIIFLTIAIGFGAINTGNNLLFLLLGMKLSLITASGILSEAVIRDLSVSRRVPYRVFARTLAPGRFILKNNKRWSSLNFEVCEMRARAESGPLRGQTFGPTYYPWWKMWRRYRNATDLSDRSLASTFVLRLPAMTQKELTATYEFPARGKYLLQGLSISTCFPFSLAKKARECENSALVTVFPAIQPAEDWLAVAYANFGDIPGHRSGTGDEYFGLRDYHSGEDRRRIHWKSSARRQSLVVQEFQHQEQRAIEICLYHCTGKPASQRHLFIEPFEMALEKTTGLIHSLHERGFQLALRTHDAYIAPANHQGHLDRLLHILAAVELENDVCPLFSQANEGPSFGHAPQLGHLHLGFSSVLNAVGTREDPTLVFDSYLADRHEALS